MKGWTETDGGSRGACLDEPRMMSAVGPEPRMALNAAQREGTVRASRNAARVFKLWRMSAFAFCPMPSAVLPARPNHFFGLFHLVCPRPVPASLCLLIRSPPREVTQEAQSQFLFTPQRGPRALARGVKLQCSANRRLAEFPASNNRALFLHLQEGDRWKLSTIQM